MKCEFV
jgi:hypothetical protein